MRDKRVLVKIIVLNNDDRSTNISKMAKPLIPIIFLDWVALFEDKIWSDWENEIPVKSLEEAKYNNR